MSKRYATSPCIVVENLGKSVTENAINSLLYAKGIHIKSCLIKEASPGTCTATIELENASEVQKAIQVLNGITIIGNSVRAKQCHYQTSTVGPVGQSRHAAAPVRGIPSTATYPQFCASPIHTKTLSSSVKVTGLASNVTEAQLLQHFGSIGVIVASCKIMKQSSSKPYAYINFRDHNCAEMAAKALHKSTLDGNIIKVRLQGAESVSSGTSIKVTHLPLAVNESDVVEMFDKFGNILAIKIITSVPPHAFVTFSSLDEAKNAATCLNHQVLKGATIKVTVVSQQGK